MITRRRIAIAFVLVLIVLAFSIARAQNQNFPPNPPVPTVVVTATTFNFAAYNANYWNEYATAGTAITGTLPPAQAGVVSCVGNAYNGSAANTGTLEIATSGSGQYIIFTDGTLSASGGYVISGGAAADFACVIGVDSTHWYLRPGSGTWTKH